MGDERKDARRSNLELRIGRLEAVDLRATKKKRGILLLFPENLRRREERPPEP